MALAITEALKAYDFVGPFLKDANQAQLQTGAWVAGRFTDTYVTGGEALAAENLGLSEVYMMICQQIDDQTGTAAQVVFHSVVASDRKTVNIKCYQALDGLQCTNATNLGVIGYVAFGKRLTETEQISP